MGKTINNMIKKTWILYGIFFCLLACKTEEKDTVTSHDTKADTTHIRTSGKICKRRAIRLEKNIE